MWAAAGVLAPEAGDRGADAPGEPAACDEQPARTPARVRVMAAMVRLFMITSVKSGVVIDRDGGLGAVVFGLVCCPDGGYAAAAAATAGSESGYAAAAAATAGSESG
jgi:hypothetical protein